MTDDDPFGIVPILLQPRGDFPDHPPEPDRVRVLTRAAALANALDRLNRWRRNHGN